jgi:hypothetical protein
MAYTKLIPQHTPGARVEEITPGERHTAYRLSIPAGRADKYRLAQVYDYTQKSRGKFPLRPPLHLNLSARTSSESIPGTWGFGLWNDPFGLSLGFGGNPFRLPALPNAVWFFGASKENHLSFKSGPRPERSEAQTKGSLQSALRLRATPSAQREVAGNGFLAQTFRSPWFHPLLIPAGLALPFSRKATRRLLGRVISEEGINLSSRHPLAPADAQESASYSELNVTQWHRYCLEWRAERVAFEVDDVQMLESIVSPNPPLGLVIWIDNQFAAFTPEGKIGFGVLENPEPAWLEIKDIDMSQG